ncbi:MAG: hypothetical protein J6D53_00005 [Blautia sp.]|nr:hypothetical protein [Blautia sp.]
MIQRRRKLSELNLIDNFLFIKLLEHEVFGPRTAEIILSTIIGRDVHVSKVHVEKVFPSDDTDLHGIRLDAYVEEEHADGSKGDILDIEPENKRAEKPLLPKRSRYYHSRMDGKLLETRESYIDLPNTWVIFITSFDPFNADRMVYTARTQLLEVPDYPYDDGATTLFLYVNGKAGNPAQDLKELMAYMKETTPKNAVNEGLREIQKGIDYIKTDRTVREAYMTWGEYIKSEREEAVEEFRAEAQAEIDKANARADEANERANIAQAEAADANKRANIAQAEAADANKRANVAQAEAADANERALAAEAELRKLQAELVKYKGIN